MPLVFLDLIIYWYSSLSCRVRWGSCFSDWFDINAGVRQGGVLSPDFYCLYIDDLILILERLNIGCHLKNAFLSVLIYADDMALLSPTLKGLQILLKSCEAYCLEWDICLNHTKSKTMAFGKKITGLCSLELDGNRLEWVDQWKYLGVTLQSHTGFSCSITARLKSFYKCLNTILRIEGQSNELVMLRLLETHCVPILTYCIEILHVSDADIRRQLRVAYNEIFRKLFNYQRNESVRELQSFLSRPTWEELVEGRKVSFMRKLPTCSAIAACI